MICNWFPLFLFWNCFFFMHHIILTWLYMEIGSGNLPKEKRFSDEGLLIQTFIRQVHTHTHTYIYIYIYIYIYKREREYYILWINSVQ